MKLTLTFTELYSGFLKIIFRGKVFQLSTLISAGKAIPSQIVSHELSLDDAPDAYKHFDKRDTGWTKIILKPEMKSSNKSAKKK